MPTPFICGRCTARLARSRCALFRSSQSLIHTFAVSTEQPLHPIPSTHHHRKSKPEFLRAKHPRLIPERGISSLASASPSQRYENGTGEAATHPTRPTPETPQFIRFTPKSRPAIRRLARVPAENSRKLKAKVLGAKGEYRIVRRDLAALYGLSPSETLHAVGQLERLLWGRQDLETAAQRLDQYVIWKKYFSIALRNGVGMAPVGDAESSPNINDAESETASHDTETAPVRTAWQRLDGDKRARLWPQMLLSALESKPHTLPALVQSTFDPVWCPSYVVEDIIYLLYRHRQSTLQINPRENNDQIQQEVRAIVTFVLRNCPPRYLVLDQSVLLLLSSSPSTSELVQHYQLLKAIEHPLRDNSLLHFASRFAKHFDTKPLAVDILRILTDRPGFDLNTPAAASVCTSLLTLNENEPLPDEQAAPDLIFEFLMKRGLRPNLLGLSALMRNFCVRGHIDTGWKVFDLMLQHGLEVDGYVYSIMLNATKKHLDHTSLQHIFGIITSRNAWSTILANDFLDLLYRENEWQNEQRRRQRKKVNNAWRPMLQLYAKWFDLAPLQKFTFFPLENLLGLWGVRPKYRTQPIELAEAITPRPDIRLMQPDSITLALMIGVHVRTLLNPTYVVKYYNHFLKLVDEKDPTALSLLADLGTQVHNGFIRALVQFGPTVSFAIKQVQKMIDAANEEKARYGGNLHHHPPSLYTWTILLNGLKNHNDMQGVLSTFKMMVSTYQVQPSLPTWNVIIQAFARAGSVQGVFKSILALEKAGFQPDDRTIKAIGMLPKRSKGKVITQLEAVRNSPVPLFKNGTRINPAIELLSNLDPRLVMFETLEELAVRRQLNSALPLGVARAAAPVRRLYK